MKYILTTALVFFVFSLYSQVVINEACPRNGFGITDEDGDAEDWIELYNSSVSTVDLNGYYLSDDIGNLTKWVFPSAVIEAGSYLTVFASGKDRTDIINHWETVVYATDMWKYIVPSAPVDPLWSTIWFDASSWNDGSGGIGYGDGDDNTILSPPVKSVFMRREFNIVDTSLIGNAMFHMDFDDGFVAYLNGVEIARRNVGITYVPTSWDELAYEEHEAQLYQGQAMAEWLYFEQDVKTVLKNGPNVLAVQVHNVDSFSSDMTALPYLTVAIKDASTNYGVPPSFIKTGISKLHTNFKLSNDGETVYLSDPGGLLMDSLQFPTLEVDNSIGRQPDGNASIFYFGKPTPDSTNNFSIACIDYNSDPVISLNAGFYSGLQTITITTTSTGATTCYTLDGSTPEDFSPVYSGPLTIDSTMVVKARSFGMGKLPSKTESNSYFIDFNTDLPVVSISTLPAHFWDWDKGIYVMGPNADTVMPYFNANFWQDWERPIHFEYFNVQGGQEFEQDFGVKIHGGWSRANDLKSLRILAKGKYGEPELNYRLFPGKDITEFKSFVLRNSGNETNVTHFRDALMHKAVQEKTHIDIQDYQPSVVFINGEYMGILNLREKISTDYLAENHGVDPDSVDLLQFDGYVIDGQNDNYLYMAEFIITNDMAIQANYEQAKEMLDIENFCDYFIAETYYINWDWPQNNVKYWRERKPGAKWRYIMTDVDFGLGLFGGAFSSNDLQRVIDQDDNSHSKMFRSLLHNQEFREYFVNRYADLINTIFLPENLSELALSFKDSLYDEMPRHMARWNGDFNAWDTYHIDGTLIGFINNRAYPARNHIQEQFALTKQVSVTLKVYPAEAGTIQINTIQPDEYPWSGVYYDGVPVTITAIPNPGYEFAFWQSPIMIQNPLHNPAFTMNLDTNDIFTAYFFGAPDTNRISISEINYNSSVSYDAGDWVELHNYGTTDIDLSGWIFKDGDDNHSFAIPNGAMLVSNSYLVLCRDTADFSAVFPGISNYTGPFDFGLSSTGETLRLYDPEGNLFISAEYYSISPWPSSPNGGGTTLELIDPYDDPGHYTNWFAGCQGGSPGGPFQPCNTEIENPSEISFDFINYPNPFSEHTTFAFKLDRAQNVEITLIDQQGKTAALVVNRRFSEGKNEVGFDASGLNQGVYYCRFRSEEFIRTRMLGIIR